MEVKARAKGCLLAGALGDALGYSVEFDLYKDIIKKYGKEGICDLVLNKEGLALISDDTQMTLFTAEGLLNNKKEPIIGVYHAYLEWLNTQLYDFDTFTENEIGDGSLHYEKRLYANRAPGTTCINALSSMEMGSTSFKINNSKGCGGVMRIAPVAIYFANRRKSVRAVSEIGCEVAAITHTHELGYIPAYFLTCLLLNIMREKVGSLKNNVLSALRKCKERFHDYKHFTTFENAIHKAIYLSDENGKDVDHIHAIGEGWVGEEAVAIALYAFLRYPNDLKKALICAVNHNGDSDSTGSICGNLIGAYLGEEALPKDWLEVLELKDVIEEISEKLVS